MVNVPGRSKGCSICRRRKIKCDGLLPECSQCVRTGFKCPGARTGAFFVHALADQPSGHFEENAPSVNLRPRAPVCQNGDEMANYKPRFPSVLQLQQPDRADIFDQHFVSHFVESFGFRSPTSGAQSPTWLDGLAGFATLPAPSLVRYSIRAGSMFFYGALTKDISIQTDACKWYSRALRSLQRLLSRKAFSYSGEEACAVVMLTHFENLAGTSEEAWFQHVQAAATMLELNGPQGCRAGYSHQLFRHLRLLVFIAAIFKNTDHAFSSSQWMTIPFEIYPKGLFDQLVDILFSLLPCLTMASRLVESGTDEIHVRNSELRVSILDIILRLYNWWARCMTVMNLGDFNTDICTNVTAPDTENLPFRPDHFPLLPQSNMPTAAGGALYDAANIITFRLLVLTSPPARLYEPRIQGHAQSILSAMKFISTLPSPLSNRGFTMVGFPLQVLETWCPLGHTDFPSRAAPNGLFANIAAYLLSKFDAAEYPGDPNRVLLLDTANEEPAANSHDCRGYDGNVVSEKKVYTAA